jgi:hypothetical protein
MTAELHLAENALALQFFLKRLESLVNVVVANENLQAVVSSEENLAVECAKNTGTGGRPPVPAPVLGWLVSKTVKNGNRPNDKTAGAAMPEKSNRAGRMGQNRRFAREWPVKGRVYAMGEVRPALQSDRFLETIFTSFAQLFGCARGSAIFWWGGRLPGTARRATSDAAVTNGRIGFGRGR